MPDTQSSGSIRRIGQIALSVHDIDRGVAFYRDVVGLKFMFQTPNVAFFDVAGVRLMLGLAESPEFKPEGTVLYFDAVNLDADFATMRDRGAEVEQTPHFIAKLGDKELWMAFFRDPFGNLFALMSER
jgi:predicted enzyme related to lactoylglutathione lyase